MNINHQRETVAKLTTYCEQMISRGRLPLLDEMNLRTFVNETCSAFDMMPVQDRLEQNLEIVRREMGRAS